MTTLPKPFDIQTTQMPVDVCPCRSTSSLLWSCLSTVIGCTWVALHPNIPDHRWTSWERFRRRATMVAFAFLAPELMILSAMRQWWTARSIAKACQDKGWTMTHAFYTLMGGFILCKNNEPIGVLDPKTVVELVLEGRLNITKDEIDDKSDRGIFAKLAVLAQTSWFLLQCITRLATGLPITPLEIASLQFSFLNFATFCFWWNKPQNVGCPHRVDASVLDRRTEEPTNGITDELDLARLKHRTTGDAACTRTESRTDANSAQLDVPLSIQGRDITDASPVSDHVDLRTEARNNTSIEELERSRPREDHDIPDAGLVWDRIEEGDAEQMRVVSGPKIYLVKAMGWCAKSNPPGAWMFQTVKEISGPQEIPEHAMTVPTYYSGVPVSQTSLSPWQHALFRISTSLMAVLFGSIHLIPFVWRVPFPSAAERTIWHISSAHMTIVPICFTAYRLSTLLPFRRGERPPLESWESVLSGILFTLFSAGYILARIAIITISVDALRALPAEAHETVRWIKLVPHCCG